jgi:hypothetical protein
MPEDLAEQFRQMLETMNAATEPTFQVVLEMLYTAKFNGAVTLHCYNGVPQILEMGKPVRIDLTRRPRKSRT